MGKGKDARKTTKKPPTKTAKEKKAAKKLKKTNKENWQEIHINPLWFSGKPYYYSYLFLHYSQVDFGEQYQ